MDMINDPIHIDGNPLVDGVIIRRTAAGKIATNIPRRFEQHSPTGFEIGYGGSGPADLALNILAIFIPVKDDDDDAVKVRAGGTCSRAAFAMHQQFKRDFLVTQDVKPGGNYVIPAQVIREWIGKNGTQ